MYRKRRISTKFLRKRRIARRNIAARKIQKLWRTRGKYAKRSAPSKLMEDCRQYGYREGYALMGPQTLYAQTILFPTNQNNSAQPRNAVCAQRNSDSITVKGIRLYSDIINEWPVPIEVHIAVVQGKSPGVTAATVDQKLFTNTEDISQTWKSFVSNTLTYDMSFKYNKINKSDYFVLLHDKFVLDPNRLNNTDRPSTKLQHYKKRYDKWLKLNKTFSFDGPLEQHPQHCPIILVWCTSLYLTDFNSLGGQQLFVQFYTNVVFKDEN